MIHSSMMKLSQTNTNKKDKTDLIFTFKLSVVTLKLVFILCSGLPEAFTKAGYRVSQVTCGLTLVFRATTVVHFLLGYMAMATYDAHITVRITVQHILTNQFPWKMTSPFSLSKM